MALDLLLLAGISISRDRRETDMIWLSHGIELGRLQLVIRIFKQSLLPLLDVSIELSNGMGWSSSDIPVLMSRRFGITPVVIGSFCTREEISYLS